MHCRADGIDRSCDCPECPECRGEPGTATDLALSRRGKMRTPAPTLLRVCPWCNGTRTVCAGNDDDPYRGPCNSCGGVGRIEPLPVTDNR